MKIKIRHVCRFATAAVVVLCCTHSAYASNHLPYSSLKEFCIATNADTKANCICGQKTADKILSKDEQQLLLGMMLQDPATMQQMQSSPAQMMALMQKFEQVTAGCQSS